MPMNRHTLVIRRAERLVCAVIFNSTIAISAGVGTTPGFNGDTEKALAAIEAKTLILTGTCPSSDNLRLIRRYAKGGSLAHQG